MLTNNSILCRKAFANLDVNCKYMFMYTSICLLLLFQLPVFLYTTWSRFFFKWNHFTIHLPHWTDREIPLTVWTYTNPIIQSICDTKASKKQSIIWQEFWLKNWCIENREIWSATEVSWSKDMKNRISTLCDVTSRRLFMSNYHAVSGIAWIYQNLESSCWCVYLNH